MTSPKFTYDDIVRVLPGAKSTERHGATAWIVGVFSEPRAGSFFESFPPGVVYSVEFEDGSSLEIHESDLEAAPPEKSK